MMWWYVVTLKRNQSVGRIHCMLPEKKKGALGSSSFLAGPGNVFLLCSVHTRVYKIVGISVMELGAVDVEGLLLFLPDQGRVAVQEQRGFERSCLVILPERSIFRVSVLHRLLIPMRCEAPLC